MKDGGLDSMSDKTLGYLIIVFLIWVIESIIIIVVANALTDLVGLVGVGKYCTIFLFWVIVLGLLSKLKGD